jgi:hypothetical protein
MMTTNGLAPIDSLAPSRGPDGRRPPERSSSGRAAPAGSPDDWSQIQARGQGFDAWNRRGLEIMTDHPVPAARILVEGMVRQVVVPGTDTVRRYVDMPASPRLVLGLFSWKALLWAVAGVGAAAGLRSAQRAYWAL